MLRNQSEICVVRDSTALARQAAEVFSRCAEAAIVSRGQFTVALSGGRTPQAAYELLASAPAYSSLRWDQIHLFWGDERHVPPEHTESNYRMVHEALLSKVAAPWVDTCNAFRITMTPPVVVNSTQVRSWSWLAARRRR